MSDVDEMVAYVMVGVTNEMPTLIGDLIENLQNLVKQRLITKLKAEMFNASEAHEGNSEAGYRLGWNARAKSLIEQLGGATEDV